MQRRLVLAAICGLAAAVPAGGAAKPLPGFRSPTGNISCFVVTSGPPLLLCSLRRSSYGAALQARCMRPDGSGVDWHGFELHAARAGAPNCTGGILHPGDARPVYVTLPYGRSWRRSVFTCVSRRTGVTCTNPRGHGIFVSRESWRAW